MIQKRSKTAQMRLPGVAILQSSGQQIHFHRRRIPHSKILEALRIGAGGARGIGDIYRLEVLPVKSRTIRLLGKKSTARIINTLLGYEVQAAYKRIHCPDLVTARYLRLFTELGCRRIRLPYDPTVTEKLLPELEAAQARLVGGVQELFPESRDARIYALRRLYSLVRGQLRAE